MTFYNVCAACGERIPREHNELSCPACGSNVFRLVREVKREEREERREEKKEEKLLLATQSKGDRVETVKILRRGVFEIDLEALFKGAPLIISDREGAYRIPINQLVKVKGER
ncbi:MAG: hypothetical protein KIH01_03980 [Candidatus Freyarchaeota archaeon]|nr:hypothetical protein [Candidatus Jordarchaeia archaeon]